MQTDADAQHMLTLLLLFTIAGGKKKKKKKRLSAASFVKKTWEKPDDFGNA